MIAALASEEISKRIRIVPWRLLDRLLFAALVVMAAATLLVNVCVLILYVH